MIIASPIGTALIPTHGSCRPLTEIFVFLPFLSIVSLLVKIEEVGFTPKEDVQTIEVFSDGYAKLPDNPTVAAWEAAFEATDRQDFHRISEYATVKGGTENEFFDDRTVVIVQCPRIQPT